MPDNVQFAVLDTLYDELTAAATAGDSERYASLFLETGTLMPPGAPVVAGRTAVRDWVDRFLKEHDLQVATFTVDDRAIGDTVAFCRWTATGTYRRRNGESFQFDQKYIDTFVKDSDGMWRFAIHMWSPNTKDMGVWADYI
jgi:uncharacterized protein (TIGR02246 family)